MRRAFIFSKSLFKSNYLHTNEITRQVFVSPDVMSSGGIHDVWFPPPLTEVVMDSIQKIGVSKCVCVLCVQPSLNPEGGSGCDVVLLNRWSVRNYQVERGDIVSVL